MATPRRTLMVLLFVLSTLVGCSTDEICDEACRIWDDRCGYSDYTYAICFDDCKWEADWTSFYVDCIRGASSCGQVEDCE
jgi:hypothetical protein